MATDFALQSQTGTITHVRQRRVIRRDPPVLPFVWHGLLPALGLLALVLYAVMPFARQQIEARVSRETRNLLDAQGYQWVNLAVSGQQVRLSGTPTSAAAGEAAVLLARQARCRTWAGPKTCAVEVVADFASAPPAPAAAPAAAPTSTAAAKACEAGLLAVVARSKIEFASASARIEPASDGVLDALAEVARGCPGVAIRIEGHTDSVGAAERNLLLSRARAEAVRAALIVRGVANERLRAEGLGQAQPRGDNATARGRAENRRIEFKAVAGG